MSDTSDLGDMHDTHSVGDNGEFIGIDNVTLLTVECIAYYLRYNNIAWIPTTDPEYLRRGVQYRYFTPEIGRALVHHCMKPVILRQARLAEFNINEWLESTEDFSRKYLRSRFLRFLFSLPPAADDYFQDLYIWAFACHLCLRAMEDHKEFLIPHVLDKLSKVLHYAVNISRFYYGLNGIATSYNEIHKDWHRLSDDEGHSSPSSSEDEDDDFENDLGAFY